MNNKIIVQGAREHNLKNINLTFPKNKMVVFTGVSGSGKSSMAFDTIYAEGQRRYVESLSSYARQFLGIMNKPDVDFIEGLSPAISIDQKTRSSNPRSTVGTITEIYDYMRLLFAKIGHPFCPNDNIEITKLSSDEITTRVLEDVQRRHDSRTAGLTFQLLSPIVRDRKGEFAGLFTNLKAKGYSKVFVDGYEKSLDDDISLIKTNKHTINVLIDTIRFAPNQMDDAEFEKAVKSRVFQAVEQASLLSDGLVYAKHGDDMLLYSQNYSCPDCGFSLAAIEPRMFSFNSPIGACESCKGLGNIQKIDPKLVLNLNLSIAEGGVLPFTKIFYRDTWFSRLFQTFLKEHKIPQTIPLSELSEKDINLLLLGTKKLYRVAGKNRFGDSTSIRETFSGVIGELEKRYYDSSSEYARGEIERYMNEEVCGVCEGMRLKKEVLTIRIHDKNIFEYCEEPIDDLLVAMQELSTHISGYEKKVSEVILKEIINRLLFLKNVGLGYLTLNRSASTLSGGESQRIRLASQIGSGLSGVIYVLDEPSIGLHSRDVNALIQSLMNLRDLGNTIVVVEHDSDTMKAADYIVDFGPKAGKHGGEVVFQGTIKELQSAKTLTAQYLFDFKHIKRKHKAGKKNSLYKPALTITGCSQYNLKNISASFPLGMLTCVTGVSGSGKSTLVVDTLYKALLNYIDGWHKGVIGQYDRLTGYEMIDKVYLVDQSAIGRTPRSNPATYMGIFDHIRDIFAMTPDAKIKGYKKGRFSFNVKGGRCEKCQGAGTIKIEMQFLPDVYVHCDVCGGMRYNFETLDVKYKDYSIYDVLKLTIEDAKQFFDPFPQISSKLQTLIDVGLGYIELGQPAPTLSGGEAQRIKLAYELSKKSTGKTTYILDEPTTGLHMYDVEKLLHALYRLVDQGNTVIVIEHNLEFIKQAEYIIDIGPEGGDRGGEVLFQGPLSELHKNKVSYTAKYLNQTQI